VCLLGIHRAFLVVTDPSWNLYCLQRDDLVLPTELQSQRERLGLWIVVTGGQSLNKVCDLLCMGQFWIMVFTSVHLHLPLSSFNSTIPSPLPSYH
jgi:hypothetical protein